ncbi:MAG: thioredoxin [Meiothermus sp.]
MAQRVGRAAPPIAAGGEWFNTAPTSLEALRGRVVLLNFWTFGCYNCDNSLPALRDYEKDAAKLRAAIAQKGITWPVVQDNAYRTWRAYGNRCWPAFYLIDKQGTVRYLHAGEISGRYPKGIAALEAQLEKLLAE